MSLVTPSFGLHEQRMRVVRLTQIDGALPNIALMKLAHYHYAQ